MSQKSSTCSLAATAQQDTPVSLSATYAYVLEAITQNIALQTLQNYQLGKACHLCLLVRNDCTDEWLTYLALLRQQITQIPQSTRILLVVVQDKCTDSPPQPTKWSMVELIIQDQQLNSYTEADEDLALHTSLLDFFPKGKHRLATVMRGQAAHQSADAVQRFNNFFQQFNTYDIARMTRHNSGFLYLKHPSLFQLNMAYAQSKEPLAFNLLARKILLLIKNHIQLYTWMQAELQEELAHISKIAAQNLSYAKYLLVLYLQDLFVRLAQPTSISNYLNNLLQHAIALQLKYVAPAFDAQNRTLDQQFIILPRVQQKFDQYFWCAHFSIKAYNAIHDLLEKSNACVDFFSQ